MLYRWPGKPHRRNVFAVGLAAILSAATMACNQPTYEYIFSVTAVTADGASVPAASAAVTFTFERHQIAAGSTVKLPYSSSQEPYRGDTHALLSATVPPGARYNLVCTVGSNIGGKIFTSLPARTVTCKLPVG